MRLKLGIGWALVAALVTASCTSATPASSAAVGSAGPSGIGGQPPGSGAPQLASPAAYGTNGPPGAPQAGGEPQTIRLPCEGAEHKWYRTQNTLAVDPVDTNVLYVGVEFKGVFKSTDGGATWHLAVNGIKAYDAAGGGKCYQEMGRITVDPANHERVLMIRIESPGTITDRFSENAGLWESLDGAESWHQLIKPGMNASGSGALALDPRDPKIIYYGSNNNPASWGGADPSKFFNTRGVLYKTTDGGATWTELDTQLVKGMRALAVFVNPKDPSEIALVTQDTQTTQTGQGLASAAPSTPGEEKGLMISHDGGAAWTSYADKLPPGARPGDGQVSLADFGHVFLWTMSSGGGDASYVSVDGAASFRKTSTMYVARYDPHDPSGDHMLGYSPFLGGLGANVLESNDAGATWHALGSLPKEVDNSTKGVRVSNFVWDPKDPKRVYMQGSGAMVWRSDDGGRTWRTILSLDRLPK